VSDVFCKLSETKCRNERWHAKVTWMDTKRKCGWTEPEHLHTKILNWGNEIIRFEILQSQSIFYTPMVKN